MASNAPIRTFCLVPALVLVGTLGLEAPAAAQATEDRSAVVYSDHHRFRVVTVAEGLEHPWGIAFLPGGDLLVTERTGQLRIVRDGQLDPQPIQGVPDVVVEGQGGLLDVALHPDFEANQLMYLSYSRSGDRGSTTAVVRGELRNDRLENVEDVFEAEAWAGGRHFGSRLDFDLEGYLYITVGDRGQSDQAQDLSNHNGTTVRLHDDGRIPSDNPFAEGNGVLPEIFTYGNRNAQGMAVHPESGEIWQNEHGPRGGDELNRIQAGANYGWPEITHGIAYSGEVMTTDTARAGMEQPVHHWTPSIAVSGMDFYFGDAFPEWEGHLFVGALRQEHIQRLAIEGEEVVEREVLLFDLGKRFREVKTGPDGYLYLLTDHSDGEILRLEPTDEAH